MSYSFIESMRDDISKVYDGPRWKERVRYMHDDQVIAVWNKFKESGKFEKRKTNKKIYRALKVKRPEVCEQITFDSYINECLNLGRDERSC